MFRNRAAVVIAALLALVSTCWPQSDPQKAWTDKHFGEVFDYLFPLKQQAGVYVKYRSHHDMHTEVPEYLLMVGYEPADSGYGLKTYVTARVRVANSASLYDQMNALHCKSPNDSVEEIRKQVQVKEWTFTEMNCPVVKTQFARFQHLRFAMPHFNEIVMHPLIHEFRVQTGTGDMNFVLSDQNNELVRWATDTRRALESCAASAQSR